MGVKIKGTAAITYAAAPTLTAAELRAPALGRRGPRLKPPHRPHSPPIPVFRQNRSDGFAPNASGISQVQQIDKAKEVAGKR